MWMAVDWQGITLHYDLWERMYKEAIIISHQRNCLLSELTTNWSWCTTPKPWKTLCSKHREISFKIRVTRTYSQNFQGYLFSVAARGMESKSVNYSVWHKESSFAYVKKQKIAVSRMSRKESRQMLHTWIKSMQILWMINWADRWGLQLLTSWKLDPVSL